MKLELKKKSCSSMMYLKKIIFLYLVLLFGACTQKQNAEQLANDNAKMNNGIKALFAKTLGEEVFKTNCITCHSLRYIQMQPAFPRKTWEKIVDKMIKNFGAPIPDSSAKAIVNYLVAAKGKQ